VEALLLAGLDEYFAGRYQEAINIWTRVAFLERGHGRARAYIDRARSALAERQRESEEQLHLGIVAYHAGETERARELLTRAIEQGGPSDRALAFLDRLNRVSAPLTVDPPPSPPVSYPAQMGRRRSDRTRWRPTVLASTGVAAVVLAVMLMATAWLTDPSNSPVGAADRARVDHVPVVTRTEVEIEQARALHAAGRSREALQVLESVSRASPLRSEADRLRADVQREILSAASLPLLAAAREPRP